MQPQTTSRTLASAPWPSLRLAPRAPAVHVFAGVRARGVAGEQLYASVEALFALAIAAVPSAVVLMAIGAHWAR